MARTRTGRRAAKRRSARTKATSDRVTDSAARTPAGDASDDARVGRLTAFTRRVHAAVRAIPHGRIASYGGIAAIMGQPRAARAVGRALCMLEDGSDVPWWRVVNRNGEISIKCSDHGPVLQRALLEGEKVKFDAAGRVDWSRFGWDGEGVPDGVREA